MYPKCHQEKSQEGVELGPLIVAYEWGKNHTCTLGCLNQSNKSFSTKHVLKILVEALTSYTTFLNFIHLFVVVFILSEVVVQNKTGQPIIL